jgi:hypothetical protein
MEDVSVIGAACSGRGCTTVWEGRADATNASIPKALRCENAACRFDGAADPMFAAPLWSATGGVPAQACCLDVDAAIEETLACPAAQSGIHSAVFCAPVMGVSVDSTDGGAMPVAWCRAVRSTSRVSRCKYSCSQLLEVVRVDVEFGGAALEDDHTGPDTLAVSADELAGLPGRSGEDAPLGMFVSSSRKRGCSPPSRYWKAGALP